ncbi:MAG: class I SAM-dependent methyltransferase [Pseudomonadota bacterium]|nr:class I SAM-dependent methyltransferase [Pseudomonadota bacterium]
MKDRTDWKGFWEEKASQTLSDVEFDRGANARGAKLDELARRELVEFIDPQPAELLLDAGCGTGANLSLLKGRVRRVVAMDYSKGALERCKRRAQLDSLANVTLINGTITQIPLPSRCVDKVICLSVLHYLDDDGVRVAFGEFARILKPGGLVILHVKNLGSLYLSTLTLAKRLKIAMGKPTKIEFFRTFSWYVRELGALQFDLMDYNSFNLVMLESMPERALRFLQFLELKHYGSPVLRNGLVRRAGADLKIKARLLGEQSRETQQGAGL